MPPWDMAHIVVGGTVLALVAVILKLLIEINS